MPPQKPQQPPAPRNQMTEQSLCIAIRNSVLVNIRYEGEAFERLYAPYVVYRTTTGKVCVFGMQIDNRLAPSDRSDPHNFEVGRISSIILTATKFGTDPRFNLSDARYRNRICPL